MTKHELEASLLRAQEAYLKGNFQLAEQGLRRTVLECPDDVNASVMLALVCANTQRQEEAIELLQHALKLDPTCLEAHIAITKLLFSVGQVKEAISHGNRAIALSPGERAVYLQFATELVKNGKQDEASTVLRRATAIFPNDALLQQNLAAVLSHLGFASDAIKHWRRAVELAPGLLVGWLKLGGFYLAGREFDEAVACARKAIAIDPNSADGHLLLAIALAETSRPPEIEAHLHRAVELNPGEHFAHAVLGHFLQEQGRFEEARPSLERTVELNPTHGLAYNLLLRSRKVTPEDEALLQKIDSLTTHEGADVSARSFMHYALGKAREDLGEYEVAMKHYDAATKLAAQVAFATQPFDQKWYSRMMGSTIEAFTRERMESLSAAGREDARPLLVVGMMRCGTTLVEQILSSHPKVAAGGELTFWHERVTEVFDMDRKRVKVKELHEAGLRYAELLTSISPSASRVTDKLPHNYAMLGLVHVAFPNARIIHIRRHPIDNCLSVYTTPYQKPPGFGLVKKNIAFAYRQYWRLMEHWRNTLPGDRFLEVTYEGLIEDREGVSRRMVEFAGLEWDDACLRHETNGRSVNTPSMWQVRQPIYKTSVARWRKFEPWLGELGELRDLCED